MNNDLISREALKNTKPEFMNEKVVRDTKYQTTKDRIYAKAWNVCNSYWLNIINNAPTVEPTYQMPKDYIKNKLDYERPTGKWLYHEEWKNEGGCGYECSCCGRTYDYAMNFCGYCGADMRGDNND